MIGSSDSSRTSRPNVNSWNGSLNKEYGIRPKVLALRIFLLVLCPNFSLLVCRLQYNQAFVCTENNLIANSQQKAYAGVHPDSERAIATSY
jgi:hypothetical protein